MTSGLRPPCSNGLMISSSRRSFAAAEVPQPDMVPTSKLSKLSHSHGLRTVQGEMILPSMVPNRED